MLFAITVMAQNKTITVKEQNKTFTVNGVTFEMVKVKGGTFTMGCTNDRGECQVDELPTHKVTVDDFYIGKFEVTQELWQAVMEYNPSAFKGEKMPVEQVNWKDCQEFIRELNVLTGMEFRLPTEAEWEYAACGGSKTTGYHFSGSNKAEHVAWTKENSEKTTHPVGTKEPNELGIYDMSGNVFEWCLDGYAEYPSEAQDNPAYFGGSYKVVRGGCWRMSEKGARTAYRDNANPGLRYSIIGLRLAL